MLQQAKREAKEARDRETELMKVEIRPMSSRTLRRLLRVNTDVKPHPRSVVIQAALPAEDLEEDAVQTLVSFLLIYLTYLLID